MKLNFNARTITLAAGLLAAVALYAANTVTYAPQPGSKVRIEGTSTVHDWWVESQIIGGLIEFDPATLSDPATALKTPPNVDVIIQVRSLKSSGKKPMDNVMYDAMKISQYPTIRYKLLDLKPKDPSKKPPAPVPFDVTGVLTVAGVSKTNTMPVTLEFMEGDKLKATGSLNVKMTDFGIQPPAPTVGLGFIKTGDDVKITFEWLTAKKAAAAAK